MLIDTILGPLESAAEAAEADGYDGAFTGEVSNDPFLPLVLAAASTERIDLGTSIAVAFARSPMSLAYTAYDLQRFCRGRFMLGLGSQVKAHITRRFSMPWGRPAAQMREFVLAMRAAWRCWSTGEPLNFDGEHYRHTLMPPSFIPAPHEYGMPQVLVAGVGDAMTRVAGEVADGFLCHAFTTERWIREHTVPALREGRRRAGREMDGFTVKAAFFLATGTDEEIDAAAAQIRSHIAFYASTPAPTSRCSTCTAGVMSAPSSPGCPGRAAGPRCPGWSTTRCWRRSRSSRRRRRFPAVSLSAAPGWSTASRSSRKRRPRRSSTPSGSRGLPRSARAGDAGSAGRCRRGNPRARPTLRGRPAPSRYGIVFSVMRIVFSEQQGGIRVAWDFETDPEYQKKLDWADEFVREEVEPLDYVFPHQQFVPMTDPQRAIIDPLKDEVRRQGLWATHLGPELGGQGFGQLKLALLNEILGRSPWASNVCSAAAGSTTPCGRSAWPGRLST